MLGPFSHALTIYIVFIILVCGGLGKKSNKGCKINGVTFSEGQVAMLFQDFCSQFVCRRKVKKNGKPSRKKQHLVLEAIPLGDADSGGCSCKNNAVYWSSLFRDNQKRSIIPSVSRDTNASGGRRHKRATVDTVESMKNDISSYKHIEPKVSNKRKKRKTEIKKINLYKNFKNKIDKRNVLRGDKKTIFSKHEIIPNNIQNHNSKNGENLSKRTKIKTKHIYNSNNNKAKIKNDFIKKLRSNENSISFKNKQKGKNKNKIPMSDKGENADSVTSRRASKKKCLFNGKKYHAGAVLATLQERCIRIVCLKVSKRESALAAELTTDCECFDKDMSGGVSKSPVKDCKYSEFSKDHSMCLTKRCPNILVQGLTKAEKTKVLELHNQYRDKVARGEETRGNPGPQPSASNMRQLSWNDELAQVAQAWANTCPTGHDCSACRRIFQHEYQVGQNLYWYWGYESDEKWDQAMSGFYDEVVDVPESLVEAYGPVQTENQIGHYTQLVWADTDAVGCGAVNYGPCKRGGFTYQQCKVYACNYGQAGNWLGLPIYEEGPPASDCPKGESNEYSGLCL